MRKRLGKLLGAFLCLGMILGLMPSQALQVKAADEHKHCVCGATHKEVGDHMEEVEDYKAWTSMDSLPDKGGCYYLTQDVTLTTTNTYSNGVTSSNLYCGWKVTDTVVLCLNGHSIIMQNPAGMTEDVDTIMVEGHLILTDCKEQGKITHAKNSDGTTYTGKGVKVQGGTFDMYGGTITENTSQYDTGGSGVSVVGASDTSKDSIFNMYGGTISCNVAKNGGGVSVSRNVDKSSSEFHMFGGNIIKNSANSNWSSYGNGGGVYVSWTAMCFLKGGSIRENSASVSGGGIYGSAFARNNANGNGGAAGIYVLGSATVTENKADGKNNNVYLRSHTADNGFETCSAKLDIRGSLSGVIGVSTKEIPTIGNPVTIAIGADTNADYSSNIVSDDTQYKIRQDGEMLVLTTADEAEHQHTWNSGEITKQPTTTAEGVKTFTCTVCGATKTEPIAKLVSNDYQIIEGANGKHTIGTDGTLSFRSNAPLSEFMAVFVDGVKVDGSNYELAEGSTIVRLKQSFLDTLSKGSHTIAIQSTGGTATANFTVAEASGSGNGNGGTSGGTIGNGNGNGSGTGTGTGTGSGSATTPTPSAPTAGITDIQPTSGTPTAQNTSNPTTLNATSPVTGDVSLVSCIVLAIIIVGGFGLLIVELRRAHKMKKDIQG